MKFEHVYFFANFNKFGISVRYRGLYVLEKLEQKFGITSSFVFPDYSLKSIFHFITIYIEILFFRKKNSIIIFQKLHTDGFYTKALKFLLNQQSKRTIYDTDDADYMRFNPENIHFFMTKCKICTVGSEFLSDYVRLYNKNIFILTSPVIKHQEIKTSKNNVFHIGWIGFYEQNISKDNIYGHKKALVELIYPVLLKLNFKFKFTILGVTKPDEIKEIKCIFNDNKNIILDIPQNVDWLNELSIYKRIKKFDIGLSPMLDDEFNQAKSAFKIKQYLSCGVPVVASPVGENINFVIDGFNGFLCSNKNDFKKRINQMYQMSDKDFEFLINNCTNDFSTDKYSHDLCEIVKTF